MNILLNGESKQVPDGITAADLIEQLGLQNKRLAMEVNLEIVPRSTFSEYRFKPDDRVEIVLAIGGG
jgi:sulfur carrier protein